MFEVDGETAPDDIMDLPRWLKTRFGSVRRWAGKDPESAIALWNELCLTSFPMAAADVPLAPRPDGWSSVPESDREAVLDSWGESALRSLRPRCATEGEEEEEEEEEKDYDGYLEAPINPTKDSPLGGRRAAALECLRLLAKLRVNPGVEKKGKVSMAAAALDRLRKPMAHVTKQDPIQAEAGETSTGGTLPIPPLLMASGGDIYRGESRAGRVSVALCLFLPTVLALGRDDAEDVETVAVAVTFALCASPSSRVFRIVGCIAARHISSSVISGAALRRYGNLPSDAVASASRMHMSSASDGPYIRCASAAYVAVMTRIAGRIGALNSSSAVNEDIESMCEEWLERIERRDVVVVMEETVYALSALWEHIGVRAGRFATRGARRLLQLVQSSQGIPRLKMIHDRSLTGLIVLSCACPSRGIPAVRSEMESLQVSVAGSKLGDALLSILEGENP